MRMTAALLTVPGEPLSLTVVHLDDPLANEVMVRTERVGLCHSDLHYVNGSLGIDLPALLGHEVSGVVERVGDAVTRLKPGDRVVATVTPSCGNIPEGVTHAIEAVGRPQTASLAFDLLAPGGTATILGLMPEGESLSIPADALIYGDRRIQGAYMGANRFPSDVEMFFDHYRGGQLDLDAMVTDVIPFAEVNEGLASMSLPTTVRIVMNMAQGQT